MASDFISLQDIDFDAVAGQEESVPGPVSPMPKPDPVPTAPAEPIRVVALRCRLFPEGATDGPASRAVARLIGRLSTVEADVIALQEVWRAEDAAAIIAATRGRYPFAARSRQPDRGWGTGLMLLSRRPFAAIHDIPIRNRRCRSSETSASGLIAIDIDGYGAQRIRIVNAQLAFVVAGTSGGRREARHTGLRAGAVARRMQRISGNGPVMLLGNLAPPGPAGQGVIAALCRRGWRVIGSPPVPAISGAVSALNPILFRAGAGGGNSDIFARPAPAGEHGMQPAASRAA